MGERRLSRQRLMTFWGAGLDKELAGIGKEPAHACDTRFFIEQLIAKHYNYE